MNEGKKFFLVVHYGDRGGDDYSLALAKSKSDALECVFRRECMGEDVTDHDYALWINRLLGEVIVEEMEVAQ